MQKKCRCLDKVSLRILIINSTIFCKKNVSNSHQCVLSRTKSDSFIGHKNFFSSLATVSKLFICLENPFYFINLKSNNNSFVQWKMGYIAPVSIYLFKVNNTNTKTRCKICSNLTIKTPERRQWRRSGIFIVNFEHISQLVLVFLLLTLNRWMSTGALPFTFLFFWFLLCKRFCLSLCTVFFSWAQARIRWYRGDLRGNNFSSILKESKDNFNNEKRLRKSSDFLNIHGWS